MTENTHSHKHTHTYAQTHTHTHIHTHILTLALTHSHSGIDRQTTFRKSGQGWLLYEHIEMETCFLYAIALQGRVLNTSIYFYILQFLD